MLAAACREGTISPPPQPIQCYWTVFCISSEWYSYHYPELVKIVNDNYKYAQVAALVGDRKQLADDKMDELEEILGDTAQAQAVFSASKSSMGMSAFTSSQENSPQYISQWIRYRHTIC